MTLGKLIRLVLWLGLGTVVFLCALWAFIDRPCAEKTATALAQPCGVMWYMLIAATLIVWKHADRMISIGVTFILLAYTTAGNGFVAEAIFRSLESPYYECRPLEEAPFDVIVLLGGGAATSPAGREQGNQSGDRVLLAAQMYHAGLTPTIVCCGNRIPSIDSSALSPGDKSISVLRRLQVPDSALLKADGTTTSRELLAVRKLFPKESARLGLVTSAWHLPRAMRLAERLNLQLHPLPADFRTGRPRTKATGEIILHFVPSSGALDAVSIVVKEYLGMLVSR